jgi:nitroimidazol reductase NimA-like FMN-containing flavoprotein (pyridoxamine 5'-phosphate oxidase superfamily)
MLIHELTTSQCRELLARTRLGHLACTRDDQPYIVPVFFDFDADDDSLYSFATHGQKVEWMRTNPQVCVEFGEIRDQFQWLTVIVFGRFEELDGTDVSKAGLLRAQALFQRQPRWWQPAAAKVVGGPEHAVPVLYRIRIDDMTGRRATRSDAV